MAALNPKNIETEKVIHLMITNKCDRNCKYCCNKQYDVNKIPIISNEELEKAERLYLTGGEPFAYANPCDVADTLKRLYPNINRAIVYTNAWELAAYLHNGGNIWGIDGLTISLKNSVDKMAFETDIVNNENIKSLPYLRTYIFEEAGPVNCPSNFNPQKRVWQKEFNAAPGSIFRRAATFYEERNE